jgi:hypothetical protein
MPAREQWFAEMLQAGLDTHVLAESDVLAHATPTVLIGSMPKDLLAQMLDAALASGTMSAKSVVQTATPKHLADHVALPVLWSCIAAGATRAKLADADGKPDDSAREFLRRALDAGLRHGVIAPPQVVQHVNAKVIATALPDALTTKLLEVSLATGKLTPEIVVDTIGVEAIAKHAPAPVVWACLAGAGEAREEAKPAPAPAKDPVKSFDFLDDEVQSVIVELDDGGDQPVMLAKPADKSRKR